MKVIRFIRLEPPKEDSCWPFWSGIAFDEETLHYKLDGGMAEVWMPGKPLYVRLWRKLFPPRKIDVPADGIMREFYLS